MPFADKGMPGESFFVEEFAPEIAVANVGVKSAASQFRRVGEKDSDVMQQCRLFDELEIRVQVPDGPGGGQCLFGDTAAVLHQCFMSLCSGGIKGTDKGHGVHRVGVGCCRI